MTAGNLHSAIQTTTCFLERCTHKHHVICDRCQNLDKILSDVENTLKTCEGFRGMEQHRDDLMHDFLQAKDAIFSWKAHILRSENQEKAKQVALKDLNETSVLIVMDWAMKVGCPARMGLEVISIQNGAGMLTSSIRRAHGVRTKVGRLK